MEKSTFAIITTVVAFAPLTAFAQNIQNIPPNSAAVGVSNYIDQDVNQGHVPSLLELDLGAYGVPSTADAQTSVQVNANEKAAIGVIPSQMNYSTLPDNIENAPKNSCHVTRKQKIQSKRMLEEIKNKLNLEQFDDFIANQPKNCQFKKLIYREKVYESIFQY